MDFGTIDAYVGKRIRMKRLFLGLSQGDLSKELGISFQQLQKYEKGINRVSASKLYHISRFLGEPVGYFFKDVLTSKQVDSVIGLQPANKNLFDSIGDDRELLEMVAIFSCIKDPKIKKQVIALIKAIIPPDSEYH